MPWETYEYLFIYEYYGISGIYIYIYVWDTYNVLQYGITMLYMEYYMERPLTMDIGIDTHETMGYLWIVVYLWILWDMNIIRNGWNHTWTQYSYSWKVYGPTLNNLCLLIPSMHMYTVYTPWRFFQSQHWKQIKKALHVQAGKPRSKKDDQAHEPYYIPYIIYMNHITMLDMEYIYIYIKTILKLDPDFITDDRTKCLLMRAILGHGRCLLCFRSMVLSNKRVCLKKWGNHQN